MPTAYIGFLLKPAGFFAAIPALDVPPSKKAAKAEGGCCH
jgi:primary-amine oxidase